jgi:hypothetical protein
MAIRPRHAAAGQVVRALAAIGIGAGLVHLVQLAELASTMFKIFCECARITSVG